MLVDHGRPYVSTTLGIVGYQLRSKYQNVQRWVIVFRPERFREVWEGIGATLMKWQYRVPVGNHRLAKRYSTSTSTRRTRCRIKTTPRAPIRITNTELFIFLDDPNSIES